MAIVVHTPDDLAKWFRRNPVRIDLSGSDFSDSVLLEALAAELRKNTTLQEMGLNRCSLGEGLDVILKALAENPGTCLHSLSLAENNLGNARQCASLANFMRTPNIFRQLSFAKNGLHEDPEGLGTLFEALAATSSPLLFLDISNNEITTLDNWVLERLLNSRPHLFLNLHGNEVTRNPEMRPALQMLNGRYNTVSQMLKTPPELPSASQRVSHNTPSGAPDTLHVTPAGSNPPGQVVGKPCSHCQVPVVNFNYRCCQCTGFRLCESCYNQHTMRPLHAAEHYFVGMEVVAASSSPAPTSPQPTASVPFGDVKNEPQLAPSSQDNLAVEAAKSEAEQPEDELSKEEANPDDAATSVDDNGSVLRDLHILSPSTKPPVQAEDEELCSRSKTPEIDDGSDMAAQDILSEEQEKSVDAQLLAPTVRAAGKEHIHDIAKTQLDEATVVSRSQESAHDTDSEEPSEKDVHLKSALSRQILQQLREQGLMDDETETQRRTRTPRSVRFKLDSRRSSSIPTHPPPAEDAKALTQEPPKATAQTSVAPQAAPSPAAPPPPPPKQARHPSLPKPARRKSKQHEEGYLPDRDERMFFTPTATSSSRIPISYLGKTATDIAEVISERCKRSAKVSHSPPPRDTLAFFFPRKEQRDRIGPGTYAKNLSQVSFLTPSLVVHNRPMGYNTRGRPVWGV